MACLTGHFHLIENMIIRAAYQDTGFSHTHIADKLEVFLVGTDPAGNLRELVASLHTFLYCIPILFAVEEKLGSTDSSFRFAQAYADNRRSLRSAQCCTVLWTAVHHGMWCL